jgi:hypothetical protein
MSLEQRHIHLRGALGAVRTELWNGREHLVVPVIALQEAAIHAVNAKNREFVPCKTLTASADRWNGHPLVVGHPTKDGRQISAHDDAVLAKHGFGFIRQAAMNGKRLGMEAMVDPARLVALKQDQLLADLRAGKNIEVSVGAFVETNDTRGTFGGRDFIGEWTTINPDHLAFLPHPGVGACSLADGCGAHRTAQAYLVTAEGMEAIVPKALTLKERILALFDSPEQAVTEEVAELVKWKVLRSTCTALGKQWDDVNRLINELIEAEDVHATGSGEIAETEIEAAKLDAIRTYCVAMSGSISALLGLTYPSLAGIEPARYADALGTLVGKRNNASDQKMIQTM